MTDEVYEYQQSMQEQSRAAHRTPISQTRIASEAENHKKDGPCQTIVLPNLPSVAGRVKYAMGAMTANQFSQRCGISATYLNQICTGKAKTLSAYNANRIAGASSMNVTVGGLLGMQQKAAPEPSAPIKHESQELPDLPDFWARLEWAVKNSGKTRNAISFEIGANTDYVSYSIRNRSAISSKYVSPLAKALGVSEEWLFKDSGLETSKAYGTVQDDVFILTCDEYRKYREFIPHYDDWIWTATPWWCGYKDSGTGYASSVRVVNTAGNFNIGSAYYGNSVVPACILNPKFLNMRQNMAFVEEKSE